MKQAFHIFRKDLRRLWMQIAAMMLAIAWFAVLDTRWSALNPDNDSPLVIECIIGAAVWFLIARAVHEESLPGEDQFWLTRPYERSSLLISKIMMAVCVVIVPLFVANCAILASQSLPVSVNLGGLVLRQFVTAAWLILPPFAIASITRRLADDVLIWVVVLAAAWLDYRSGQNVAVVLALLLISIAVGYQFFTRGTKASRALMAAAVLLAILPLPQAAHFALAGFSNDPATSAISLTPKSGDASSGTVEKQSTSASNRDMHCVPIPLAAQGVQPDWRVSVVRQEETFQSPNGKTWNMHWRDSDFNNSPALTKACIDSAGLKELGADNPLTVHISLALAVYAEQTPIKITASLNSFDVPGVGRCQFQIPIRTVDYFLFCKSPVWFPSQGRVLASAEEWQRSSISWNPYPWVPMNLLPGFSPVYKWVTLSMDRQIREAIAHQGQIEFRPEKPIALLRREITVKEVAFHDKP